MLTRAYRFSYARSLLLGLFLAVMVSIVVPAISGFNVAHAAGWGTEGSGSISGPPASISNPRDDPPAPISETAGSGDYTNTCNGLRPSGMRPIDSDALCQQHVVDLRNPHRTPPGAVSCPVNSEAVGVSWVAASWYDREEGSIVAGSLVTGNYRCISIAYRDVSVVCLNNASVEINMFQPASRGLSTVTAATPWGQGARNYDACLASTTAQAASYVPIVDYGRYSAQFRLYAVVAQFRLYDADPFTGARRDPQFMSASGPQQRNQSMKYLQYTCAGTTESNSNNFGGSWTWTENDCAPGNPNGTPPSFQCVNMESPTVNGVPNSQVNQILRDGKANSIIWNTPRVEGASLVGVSSPSTTLTVSGTPTFANSQLTLTRDGAGLNTNTNYTNRIATNYELKARWASDTGNPIVLNQSYSWMGTWSKTSVAITGVDFTNETFIITPTTVQTQALVTCNPGNVSFDVLRAANG